MKVYKYRGLENFTRDLESLVKDEVFAPPFTELNDPFEAVYDEEITHMCTVIENLFKVNTSDITRSFESLREYKSKLGIYSLSKTYSDELMWAHYASSYKGFCIEYDKEILKNNYLAPKVVLELDVEYKNAPQKLTLGDIRKRDIVLKKLFATKSFKWSYEKEIRLIFDSYEAKKYNPKALKGIYFGTRLPTKEREALIDSLTNRDVQFYEIYRLENTYKVERRLIHENKRQINKLLNTNCFEIIETKHAPKVENFCVFYKGVINEESLNYFFESFRENIATRACNINLFDEKSISHLVNKYPLMGEEYVRVADHYIAISTFDDPVNFEWYPFQDFTYEENGGKNRKKYQNG